MLVLIACGNEDAISGSALYMLIGMSEFYQSCAYCHKCCLGSVSHTQL